MKLRNKRTGDVWEFEEGFVMKASQETAERAGARGSVLTCFASSLTELNKEWEDVPEEPKDYYCIDWTELSGIYKTRYEDERDEFNKEIGNYFKTKEEVEKAVEKLKAWKRLKDKGFRFIDNKIIGEYGNVSYRLTYPVTAIEEKDLDLLFGGEE